MFLTIVPVLYYTTVASVYSIESVVFCCISCILLHQLYSVASVVFCYISCILLHQLHTVDSLSTDRCCKRYVLGNNIFCPLRLPL